MQLEENDSNKGDGHDDTRAASPAESGLAFTSQTDQTDDPRPRSPAWMELSNK